MSNFYSSGPPAIPWSSRPDDRGRRASQSGTSTIMLKNAVYYPNYRVYRGDTPASMDYNCISHVFYAFAHLSPDGNIIVGVTKH